MTGVPFEFDFVNREPAGSLGRFVASIWYARGTVPYAREKIAPTGATVAVFVLGSPILHTSDNGDADTIRYDRGFIVGSHDRPTVNEPTGETFAVGIVATAIGCEAVFGIRPSLLRGTVADLEHVWPEAKGLRRLLIDADGSAAKLDVVQDHLESHVVTTVPGVDRCSSAVAVLASDPTKPIGDIADMFDISHSHLDREFARVVGLSPRALARLLRMRRLLASIEIDTELDWAGLAAEHGWFDQSHFIRDFRRHTGVTPTQYVAAQAAERSAVAPGDAAGFVPER